jgi:hypothetical protein
MAVSSVRSGLIQRVTPASRSELYEIDALGSNAQVVDLKEAVKDANSPNAIPDVPTTEAPYDGRVCFGIFLVDIALDG